MRKASFVLLLAAPLLLAARSDGNVARAIASDFAGKVSQGQDFASVLTPAAVAPDERAELDLLAGCKVSVVERMPDNRDQMPNFGIQWQCPRGKQVGRTAAVVRVKDGLVQKVLMSTIQENF